MVVMPDIKIYVPDEMYYRLKKTPNRSKLVQQLLEEYWQKENSHRKTEKKKDVIKSKIGREEEHLSSIMKPRNSTLINHMRLGV